jgi:hypothetical protein
MKRLRDTHSDEPLFRRGVEVIEKTPPTPEIPDVKQRVWRSINQPGAAAPRPRILLLNLAMVAIVALIAGTAGAVIAHRWMVSRRDGVAPPARSMVPAPRADKADPSPPVALAADTVEEIPSPSPKSPVRSTPKKVASAAPSAASVARERTEVLDALVALRREHDPVRASTLLARYLSAHPHGALREEALVLAIEAADARGDRAAGEQLARAYQAEFPEGRFLPFARSHTSGQARH